MRACCTVHTTWPFFRRYWKTATKFCSDFWKGL